MSRTSKIDRNLLATLMVVNRTTIVRVLANLDGDLGCAGATRSTRYLMRRTS